MTIMKENPVEQKNNIRTQTKKGSNSKAIDNQEKAHPPTEKNLLKKSKSNSKHRTSHNPHRLLKINSKKMLRMKEQYFKSSLPHCKE